MTPNALLERIKEVVINFGSMDNEENRKIVGKWLSFISNEAVVKNVVELFNEDEREASKMISNLALGLEHSLNRAERRGRHDGRTKGRQQGLLEGLEKGLEKGRQEGIEKGIEKGRKEMIRSLYDQGLEIAIIAKAAKLTNEEVEEILRKCIS